LRQAKPTSIRSAPIAKSNSAKATVAAAARAANKDDHPEW
jgi:hypothetical protein